MATDLGPNKLLGQPMTLSCLSAEVMGQILDLLSVCELLQLERVSRQIQTAVLMSLKLRKHIHFLNHTSGTTSYDNFSTMTDFMFASLLRKMPNLEYVYDLTPTELQYRSFQGATLSAVGIVSSLSALPRLKGVQTNDATLLEDLLTKLPRVEVLGCYGNREGWIYTSPQPHELTEEMNLTHIHLDRCPITNLGELGRKLKYIFLRSVRFVEDDPFRLFDAPGLETFIFSSCREPRSGLKYMELLNSLAKCEHLNILELADLPILGGMFKQLCRQHDAFPALHSLSLSLCGNVRHYDIISLVKKSSLRRCRLQASISSDDLMRQLEYGTSASEDKSSLTYLSLGWQSLDTGRAWEDRTPYRYMDPRDSGDPTVRDDGIRSAATYFHRLETLHLSNCSSLVNPLNWISSTGFLYLRELSLSRCGRISLQSLIKFLVKVQTIECLTLDSMFRIPDNSDDSDNNDDFGSPSDDDDDEVTSDDDAGIGHSPPKMRRIACLVHDGSCKRRKTTAKCTCLDDMDADLRMVLKLEHPRLARLKINETELKHIDLECPKLKTVNVTNCSRLKGMSFCSARELSCIHVSDCPRLNKTEKYRSLTSESAHCSRFISLRPTHKIDEDSFCKSHMSRQHGSVFVFDYSIPYETEHNVRRAESWLPLFEYLTKSYRAEYGCKSALEKQTSEKNVYKLSGENENSSKWTVITDVPWLRLLSECQDLDEAAIYDHDARKAGVYCREVKGHTNCQVAYNDLKMDVESVGPENLELYPHNVIMYINMWASLCVI